MEQASFGGNAFWGPQTSGVVGIPPIDDPIRVRIRIRVRVRVRRYSNQSLETTIPHNADTIGGV